MKKIQFKSLSWTEAGLLRASLRRQLIAQHPDIREMGADADMQRTRATARPL